MSVVSVPEELTSARGAAGAAGAAGPGAPGPRLRDQRMFTSPTTSAKHRQTHNQLTDEWKPLPGQNRESRAGAPQLGDPQEQRGEEGRRERASPRSGGRDKTAKTADVQNREQKPQLRMDLCSKSEVARLARTRSTDTRTDEEAFNHLLFSPLTIGGNYTTNSKSHRETKSLYPPDTHAHTASYLNSSIFNRLYPKKRSYHGNNHNKGRP